MTNKVKVSPQAEAYARAREERIRKIESGGLSENGLPVVAVWLGVTVKLRGGRTVPYLACSRYSNAEGFLAPGAKKSSATVRCPLCERPHEVYSLADAIKFDQLNVLESFATIPVSEIVAMTLQTGGER
jgi:hypothetical protein